MHKMKEEVILRILAQESLKSELRLRIYGEKNFRDLFVISGKWLGVFLEIFLNYRVPVRISVERGLISDNWRGFFAKRQGISAGDLFFNRKYHGGLDGAAREHCGPRQRGQEVAAVHCRRAALGR
jgi:hypothetical protein